MLRQNLILVHNNFEHSTPWNHELDEIWKDSQCEFISIARQWLFLAFQFIAYLFLSLFGFIALVFVFILGVWTSIFGPMFVNWLALSRLCRRTRNNFYFNWWLIWCSLECDNIQQWISHLYCVRWNVELNVMSKRDNIGATKWIRIRYKM